jgi:lipoprotein
MKYLSYALASLVVLSACASHQPRVEMVQPRLPDVPTWVTTGEPSTQQVNQQLNKIFSNSESTH